MKNLIKLITALLLCSALGCFSSRNGAEKDVIDFSISSDRKIAEEIADIICAFFKECPLVAFRCSDPGGCRAVESDLTYQECHQQISEQFVEVLACKTLTKREQEQINRCLAGFGSQQCEEPDDDFIREYEQAQNRGEDPLAPNIPESCSEMPDIMECKEDDYPEDEKPVYGCAPGSSVPCNCPNGLRGYKLCLSDGSYSSCDCDGAAIGTGGVTGVAGFAGSGGVAVTGPPDVCIVDQTVPCDCADGIIGFRVCVDGKRFSPCECLAVVCEPDSVFEADAYAPYIIDHKSDLGPLSGYARMQGDLFIRETNVDYFGYLTCLTHIAGHFDVSQNQVLMNLNGLSNLTEVGWSMTVHDNDNLTHLEGLANLTSIGRAAGVAGGQPGTGHLEISDNDSLRHLKGLAGLNQLDGDLIISDNSNLPTCEAEALKTRLENAGWNRNAIICGNLPDECGSDSCTVELAARILP